MIGSSITFRSDFRVIGSIPAFPESAICDEPALRGCSIAWARENGGPILNAFIDALPEDWLADPRTIVRTMPVWLKQGWGSGHVGWHLDGITARADGQEDWLTGRPADFERIGCNMGTNAPTLVLVGDVKLPAYPEGQPLNALVLQYLRDAEAEGVLRTVAIGEGDLFVLNSSTLHSVSAASRDGWRMFFDANRPSRVSGGLPVVDTFYSEVYTDFQPTTAREESLMAAYHAMDPR